MYIYTNGSLYTNMSMYILNCLIIDNILWYNKLIVYWWISLLSTFYYSVFTFTRRFKQYIVRDLKLSVCTFCTVNNTEPYILTQTKREFNIINILKYLLSIFYFQVNLWYIYPKMDFNFYFLVIQNRLFQELVLRSNLTYYSNSIHLNLDIDSL